MPNPEADIGLANGFCNPAKCQAFARAAMLFVASDKDLAELRRDVSRVMRESPRNIPSNQRVWGLQTALNVAEIGSMLGTKQCLPGALR